MNEEDSGVRISNREIYDEVKRLALHVEHLVVDTRNIRTAQNLLVHQLKDHHSRLGTLETFKAVALGVLKVLAVVVPIGIPILLFALSH